MQHRVRLAATIFGAISFLLITGWVPGQTPGGNPAPRQDRTRTELRQHQPGTSNPGSQLKKQLRGRIKGDSQAGGATASTGSGPAATEKKGGGKKYGPVDGSGNQGAGPRDGSGFGPGDCSQPKGSSGTRRRAGGSGKDRR